MAHTGFKYSNDKLQIIIFNLNFMQNKHIAIFFQQSYYKDHNSNVSISLANNILFIISV